MHTLNSNLILLILFRLFTPYISTISFKFQSDSINTDGTKLLSMLDINFKFQSDSINTAPSVLPAVPSTFFKFQSDSINTSQNLTRPNVEATLNSNLILLILRTCCRFRAAAYSLNSNLILLIRYPIHTYSSELEL